MRAKGAASTTATLGSQGIPEAQSTGSDALVVAGPEVRDVCTLVGIADGPLSPKYGLQVSVRGLREDRGSMETAQTLLILQRQGLPKTKK